VMRANVAVLSSIADVLVLSPQWGDDAVLVACGSSPSRLDPEWLDGRH